MEDLKRQIDQLLSASIPNETRLAGLYEELKKTYKNEEDHWYQRSRQLWLNLGDKNTCFFHASTRKRRTLNKLTVIEDADGKPMFTEEDIAATMETYFANIFTPVPATLTLWKQ